MATTAGARSRRSSDAGPAADYAGKSDVLDTVGRIFSEYVGPGGAASRGGHRGDADPRGPESSRHDDESSMLAEMSGDDIRRLGRLWRDMRSGHDAGSPSGSPEAAKARKAAILASEAARKGSPEGRDARDHARFLELQLVRARDEAGSLKASYRDVLTRLSECMRVLKAKAEEQQRTSAELDKAKARAAAVEAERESLYQRSLANLREYERDSAEKQRQLNAAQSEAEGLRVRMEATMVDMERVRARAAAVEASAASASQTEADALTELERVRADAEALASEATSASQLRSMVRHLRADNARLIRLLASTPQFERFAAEAFPEDARTASGRHRSTYLAPAPRPGQEADGGLYGGPTRPIGARGDAGAAGDAGDDVADWAEVQRMAKHYAEEVAADRRKAGPVVSSAGSAAAAAMSNSRRSASRPGGRAARRRSSSNAATRRGPKTSGGLAPSAAELASAEGLHWVPADAVSLTAEFRSRFLAHVPAEEVRVFLRGLNSAWKARSRKALKLQSQKHSRIVAELRRHVQQRQPYREVLQASAISRLHTELTAVRYAADGVLEPGPAAYRRAKRAISAQRGGGAAAGAGGAAGPRPGSMLALAGGGGGGGGAGAGGGGGGGPGEYGWAPQWSWNFPAASGGALGHNTATGWTPAREHAALMEQALATVDGLSRRVAELEEENAEASGRIHRLRRRKRRRRGVKRAATGGRGAAGAGVAGRGRRPDRQTGGVEDDDNDDDDDGDDDDDDLDDEAAELEALRAARLAVARARLTAHTRAVTWLGGHIVRMADSLGDEVSAVTAELRRVSDGGGASGAGGGGGVGEVGVDARAVRQLAAEADKAVTSYRARCRRAFETGLEAGSDEQRYGGILGPVSRDGGRGAEAQDADAEAVETVAAAAAAAAVGSGGRGCGQEDPSQRRPRGQATKDPTARALQPQGGQALWRSHDEASRTQAAWSGVHSAAGGAQSRKSPAERGLSASRLDGDPTLSASRGGHPGRPASPPPPPPGSRGMWRE